MSGIVTIKQAMGYSVTRNGRTHSFADLKTLLAKATPARSGDALAGIAAENEEERALAKMALAEVPLTRFLEEPLIPYEEDEVTRLIVDTHDAARVCGDSRADGGGISRVAASIRKQIWKR